MLDNSFTIRSARTISELETFVWKNGRPDALQGYNDDLILALCIGLWVRDTALRLRLEGIELTKLSLDKTSYSSIPHVQRGLMENNPYEMDIGGERKEDLTWLIS
jgi:hypothetical protein